LSSSFFSPARQGDEGNSRHSDRNIRGTCTIVGQVKTWVAQFKSVDFSTCDAPHPGRLKTVTTPEIIDQIHELIWKTAGFRLNQYLSNWASHVSGLGPSFMKFGHAEALCEVGSDMPERGSKTSTVPVVSAIFGIFSARSK